MDSLDQLVQRRVGHDRARAVELDHEGVDVVALGLADRAIDEVGFDRIEIPVDLDHGDEAAGLAALVGLGARGRGQRRDDRDSHQQDAEDRGTPG